MKTKFIIIAIVVSLMWPAPADAFAILRYVFDAVANQLGLDRGPVPKTLPKAPPDVNCGPTAKHPDSRQIYIQAEGF